MRSNSHIKLVLVIFLALFLRFWGLGQNPPSLNWDEAAQGYNAFALGITGKDEFGRSWPLDYLESFGDFKPVLYTYAAILPIKFWGLNEFSTRFPSAFFGTLTVLLSYYLVIELFVKSENKKILALLTSLFLAISPWHMMVSRGAFEANLGLFLVVLGTYLLLRGLNGRKTSMILSALPFAAIFYTFNSTRAFIPIFLVLLAFLFLKEWKKFWKQGLLFICLFLLFLLPILPHLFSPQARLRFNEVNIFSDLKPIELSNTRMGIDNNAWWSRIIHNRRLIFTMEFLKHYTDNLNLRFLFVQGDGNPKFSIQDSGQMYFIDLPFFFLGLFILMKKYPERAKLIFLWVLVGIIPAATARETPHALRTLQTLPTWQIILAIGWLEFWLWTKDKKIEKIGLIAVIILLLFNVSWYLHNYYDHYPREFAGEWQYGYKQAIDYIKPLYNNYDYIVFTNYLGRPYIYILFYNQYSPEKYRLTAKIKRDVFGFVNVLGFDKYRFGEENLSEAKTGQKGLFVVSPGELPEKATVKKTVRLPNDTPVLEIYEK